LKATVDLEISRQKILELQRKREILRKQLLASIRKPSLFLGLGLLSCGFMTFVYSTVLQLTSIILVGIGLFTIGAILLIAHPRGFLRADVIDCIKTPSIISISCLLNSLKAQKGVYLPPNYLKQIKTESIYLFIPLSKEDNVTYPLEIPEERTIIQKPYGILLVPFGYGLMAYFERSMGIDFSKCNLNLLPDILYKALVEETAIASEFTMRMGDSTFSSKITGEFCHDYCSKIRNETIICGEIGCYVCSALACIIARSTKMPVSIEKIEVFEQDLSVQIQFRASKI